MKSTHGTQSERRPPTSQAHVCILGPNHLQNQLLLNFLEEKTDFICRCVVEINLQKVRQKDPQCKYLFMVDSKQADLSSLWETLIDIYQTKQTNCLFALYNVDPEMEIEKEALERGIHGIFYNKDGLAGFAKGAKAILAGELWFSRKLLSHNLLNKERTVRPHFDATNTLTHREKEILTRLITGASNKKIAEDLFISPHTVKTHIYNVYKKLDINNRLQATLWAAKHL